MKWPQKKQKYDQKATQSFIDRELFSEFIVGKDECFHNGGLYLIRIDYIALDIYFWFMNDGQNQVKSTKI